MMGLYPLAKVERLLYRYESSQWPLIFLCLASFIHPSKKSFSFVLAHVSILNNLAHLRILEGVSDDHLFLLKLLSKAFSLETKLIEVET